MFKKIKKFLNSLGPGFITGASDDDPSGIATYSQSGAQFGYHQLWTSPFSFPFMLAIQEMCGRIGIMTGKGLSGVIRHHYPRPLLFLVVFILVVVNSINIGANIGAMASATQSIINLPFLLLLILITATTLSLEILISYKVYVKYLKYLAFSLFAYIIVAFIVKQNWMEVLAYSFIPTIEFNRAFITNIVAILGTTISPYLFFWQTSEEVEEEVAKGKLITMGRGIPTVTNNDIKQMRMDTTFGMLFSNLIMFFIIMTTASTLHANGITNINTADQAAAALKPLAGDFSYLLFALGILGTGLLSVPVLAGSASYAVSELFGWREGLYRKFSQAHGFYGVIIFATLIGGIVNFIGIPPFKMLYYSAVLGGIAAPPLMILILLISNNKKIMGERINSKLSNILGITITVIMTLAAIALLVDLII